MSDALTKSAGKDDNLIILSDDDVKFDGRQMRRLVFSNWVNVVGLKRDGVFELHLLEVPTKLRGDGNAVKALAALGAKFRRVVVFDPVSDKRRFWNKMLKRGLVHEIVFSDE